jgi:hypothetical protein
MFAEQRSPGKAKHALSIRRRCRADNGCPERLMADVALVCDSSAFTAWYNFFRWHDLAQTEREGCCAELRADVEDCLPHHVSVCTTIGILAMCSNVMSCLQGPAEKPLVASECSVRHDDSTPTGHTSLPFVRFVEVLMRELASKHVPRRTAQLRGRECSVTYDDLVPVAPSFALNLHAKQDCGLIILSDGARDQSNQIFLPIVCPTYSFLPPQDIGNSGTACGCRGPCTVTSSLADHGALQ